MAIGVEMMDSGGPTSLRAGSTALLVGFILLTAGCGSGGEEVVRGNGVATAEAGGETPETTDAAATAEPEETAAEPTEADDALESESEAGQSEEPEPEGGESADGQDAGGALSVDDLDGPPQNPAEWQAVMESLPGSVNSFADPYLVIFDFFPEGVMSPPDADLVFEWGGAEASEFELGPSIRPGLDMIRLNGDFLSPKPLDELMAWYDTTYADNATWEIDQTDLTETADGRRMSYFFATKNRDELDGSWRLTIWETETGSRLGLSANQSNLETMESFELLSTIASELPKPLGAFPETVRADVASGAINQETSSITTNLRTDWTFVDVDHETIADDLVSQLPLNGITALGEPEYNDGLMTTNIDISCEGTASCWVNIMTQELTDSLGVSWSYNYRGSSGG